MKIELPKHAEQCQHDSPVSLWVSMKCDKCGCTQSNAIGGKWPHQDDVRITVNGEPVRVVGVAEYRS